MRYEITKDKEDLYVLVINNIVVLISRDISEINAEIENDVDNRKNNPKRTYEPALVTDLITKERLNPIEESNPKSLGKLFTL